MISKVKRGDKIWSFRLGGEGIVLIAHTDGDKSWRSIDERPYYSKLDRPSDIPQDVVDEAIAEWVERFGSPKVYVGWAKAESEYVTDKVSR